MISYQCETLYDVVHEVQALLELHYQELTLNRDKIALAPMWERYAALEQAGAFVIYTARSDGKLIGYSSFFVQQHIDYPDLMTAISKALFLHPDFRKGWTGIAFIEFCRTELKKIGIQHLCWTAKPNTPLIKILGRLGYLVEEIPLGKFI